MSDADARRIPQSEFVGGDRAGEDCLVRLAIAGAEYCKSVDGGAAAGVAEFSGDAWENSVNR